MASFQKPPTVNDDHRAQDIYRKAADIIFDKGFEATSMGDIADSVDLTKGGLYYYIKGKKALLFAIMNFALDLLDQQVVKPALTQSSPAERLEALVSGHIRLMLREPSAMTILVHEAEGLEPAHQETIRVRKKKFPELLEECIAGSLGERQPATAIDPEVAAHSMLGMIHWVGRWHRQEDSRPEDQMVEQLTHLALYGLTAPQAVIVA